MLEKRLLTKREKIALIVLGVTMIVLTILFQFTSFEMTEGWEVFLLIFIGSPLGFMIATDSERRLK